jgi:thiol-disulfide isomerase/thioredoxin
MKKLLLFVLSMFSITIYAQELKLTPENPIAGKAISMSYDAMDGDLKGHNTQAVVYELQLGNDPIAHDIKLTKGSSALKGTFTPQANTDALVIKFTNFDETVVDANDKLGYIYMMHNGNTVAKESRAAVAEAITLHRRKIVIDAQIETAQSYLMDEMKANPSIASNSDFIAVKAIVAGNTQDDGLMTEVKSHINKLTATAGVSEEALEEVALISMYMGDRELNANINAQILNDYPEGTKAFDAKMEALADIKDADERGQAVLDAEKEFEAYPDMRINYDYMLSSMASHYGRNNNEEKMNMFASKINSPTVLASMYNEVAWTLSGESIDAEPINADFGARISKKGLDLISKEKEMMTQKPVYQSEARYTNNMKFNYAMYADTYGLLAHQIGKSDEALKYQTIAVEANEYQDGDMNTRYATYLENAKGAAEVMPFLEKMIGEGKAGTGMKSQYERIFKETMSVDMAYDKVVAMLEKEARAKHKDEIKESLFHEAPKEFSLKTMEGEEVDLDDMKGKVVILDFWATWCGPCKAAFPGMQMAVDKYADDPNVEFLFIDTWERVEDKEANAIAFMESKGYNFNVIMDNDNSVVKNYGITGIPTKFILDQAGNIRFKSVGFDGNDAKLVDEISIVIELLMSEKDSASVQP